MKNLITVMTATLLFAAPVLGLACDYPDRPTLPDGSTASKEDMIAAQSDVKAFLAAVDEYLDCIEQEEKDAIAALPEIDESDEEAVAGREAEISLIRSVCANRYPGGPLRWDALMADKTIQKTTETAFSTAQVTAEQWNQQVRGYNARKSEQDSE